MYQTCSGIRLSQHMWAWCRQKPEGLSTRDDNKISKAASFEYISCIEYWNEILLEVSTHTFSNLFITFLLTEDSYIVYSMCDFVVQ